MRKVNYSKIKLLMLTFLISALSGYSTTYYSIASTGWSTPSTWSTDPILQCAGAASLTAPGSGDDVVICVGTTVTMDGNAGACNSLTINGTATWTSAYTTNVGAGGITINVGGNITGVAAGILTTTGGLTLNATLTSNTVTIKTITTPGQTISGTGTLAKLDISANTTNNGTITVNTTLASTVASTLTQGGTATLTFKGSTSIIPTLDATAAGNTVVYGGAAQNIKSTTYHHLTISGSVVKTLSGAITVNGNLTVSAGELYTSTYQITGNATGLFTLAAGTTLTIGNNASATNVLFPTGFITANISFSNSSTAYYYGNSAQTISSAPTYGNLLVRTYSGSKSADGNLNIAGTLTTISPTTLNMSTYTLNLSGAYVNNGGLSFTSGNFNITGSFTNTGTFTCGTGTVTYNGAAQTVRSTTYNNLVVSGSSTKTLGGAITVNGNLTVSAGTLSTSTYQITGNAAGVFSLAAGTILTLGSTGSATNILFPTNYINGNISLSSTSTVTYQGNNAQTISTVPTYGNLTINTYSGSKVADGNITLAGNLVTTSPSTLSMTTFTLNVSGTYTGTGALSFSSGNFDLTGTFTNTGAFTCGTGTVTYNGGGAQTVRGVNYNNLVFSGAGTKTLQAAATIGIAGDFTRGTMTVTPGATNTVTFNGGVQNMTGNATTFTNLTITGTSLTVGSDISVNSTLTITAPAVLNMTTYTLTVTTTFGGTGNLSFTTGTFNIAGSFSNSGTFTCGTGTVNYSGGSAQTVKGRNYYNLIFSGAGSKTLEAATTIGIAADFTRGTMTVTPGATNIVSFTGGAQLMTGNATTFTNLTLNSTSLTIPADITVNSTLTFTAGTIITGANNVIIPAAGAVARTSGHVIGNLRKNVSTGSNITRTFEIGTGSDYTPLDIVFASVTSAGNLTASTTSGDHAAIASSGFNASLTVNRYWTLTNTSIVYTSYSATCNFVNADKDPGLTTSSCIIKTYNGAAWGSPGVGTQGANATQGITIAIPVSPNTVYLQIGENTGSSTGKLYSIATGNWGTTGTWSETSGGASCGCIPSSLDTVFIENGFTVTMDGNPGAAKSLTIKTGGIATWASAYTTNIGSGGVSIEATGDITGSGAGILATAGGLTLNKVLTSTSLTIKTVTTSGQIISGTGTVAKLDISANTTNNGTITVTTTLGSTIASTLTQSATATLNYNGTTVIAPTLDPSAAGNTVVYGGATQTVKSATYHHLTISGSAVKTLGGAITVNGNLTVSAGELYTSTYQITGNASGLFTLAAGTTLTIGNNASATNVLFPTNFITANISFANSSTAYYYGNSAQTISSVPNYGSLLIRTYSGSKSADGDINVSGTLTTLSPTTFNMSSYTLNLSGAYINNGSLSFTSGNFNIAGTFTNTGSFTCGTGTVNYNGGGAQTVRGVNYNNLIFSGAGTKTLQAAATVGIAGDFTRGTMTVTPGATNTVLFNGAAQIMTGNATTFTNLTINNTSLTIPADITVNSVLTFTAGNIITGASTVILPAAGSVARTSGHVIGNLRKNIATGAGVSKTFELGTGANYTPLDITFASVSTGGNLTASTTSGDHAAIATSGFLADATVNRYWTLTNSGIVYTNYDVTCTFVDADKDAGLNTAVCAIRIYDGAAWSTPTVGTRGANSTQATTITIPVTPNTVYLQIGEKACSSTGSMYSIATGFWTTASTWSETSGGPACSCYPSHFDNVIIENNKTVTMDGSSVGANSLDINTGGVANWTSGLTTAIGAGGINIDATGDITGVTSGVLSTSGGLNLNKVLTSTSVTIKTVTTAGQTISGTGTLGRLEINVNTTNLENITLTDVLTVSAGTFTNSGTFTLKSDAVKYARIAPVGATGAFSGNFVVERYLPTRGDHFWVDLASPVSGSTLQDWDNELFLEYAFTSYWSDRPEGTNIYPYDEPSALYYEVNSGTSMLAGQGFEVGLVDNYLSNSFAAKTLNSIGTPIFGDQVINISYTAANGNCYNLGGYSGEVLAGNPYASAYQVDQLSFAGVLSSIDVLDGTTGTYVTLSGTDIIGPHQGFWAYTTANASGTLSFLEANKSTNTATAIRSASKVNPFMKLTISSADGSNTYSHTLKVACNKDASNGFDEMDHPFRSSPNKLAPSITANGEFRPLSISTFNSNTEEFTMPLYVTVGKAGKYLIDVKGVEFIYNDYSCVTLEDKVTKQLIDLNGSTNYTFFAAPGNAKDRFALHFSKNGNCRSMISTTNIKLDDQVQILQNQFGNIISFNYDETINTTISVIGILGQTIINDLNLEASTQSVNIVLPADFHGLYFVKVRSEKGEVVKKFVKP